MSKIVFEDRGLKIELSVYLQFSIFYNHLPHSTIYYLVVLADGEALFVAELVAALLLALGEADAVAEAEAAGLGETKGDGETCPRADGEGNI